MFLFPKTCAVTKGGKPARLEWGALFLTKLKGNMSRCSLLKTARILVTHGPNPRAWSD